DPHPAQVLAPDRAPRRIMTPAQRQEHLAALGVDALAVLPFTRELAAESPEAFVRQALVGRLGALSVVVGEDFRFGAARAGDVPLLRQLGSRLGFDVVAVPAVVEAGSAVSSTRIREALAEGDVETAAALLGRPHFVDGLVVAGQARGRTLGFPTANLASDNEIFPRTGVYAARVLVDFEPGKPGEGVSAAVNLGRRPTFGGGEPTVEAHLLDFDGELYGRSLRVSFMARLRDERRFDGPEALKAQIQEDIRAARRVLGSRVIVPNRP
ncbi:MAG TPA: riboflavin biosynthesis protein RibF, partial [Vicinamibacteria bacterium]